MELFFPAVRVHGIGMYRVNGTFPNKGCSAVAAAPGDQVEWVYTCDLGWDVGGGDSGQLGA